MGRRKTVTDILQRVLNSAARVVTNTCKYYDRGLHHATRHDLHWLDVTDRILFQTAVTVYAVAVQKWRNQLTYHFGCGLECTEGSTSSTVFARWRQCAHMGGHIGATRRIRLNCPPAAAMRSYGKLL